MKSIREYRKMSNEELKKRVRELLIDIMQSYSFVEKPKTKRENRPLLRREIAKIKTVIKEREKK